MQNLTSMKLVVHPQPDHGDGPVCFASIPTAFYSQSRTKISNLTSLTIHFDLVSPREPGQIYSFEFEYFTRLPLEYVSFHKACLYDNPAKEPSCKRLAEAWPRITELHWPDQHATTQDLVCCSVLPELRHLTLNITITSVLDSFIAPSRLSETFRVLESSKLRHFNHRIGNVEYVAR
jgi:hypothetical protein